MADKKFLLLLVFLLLLGLVGLKFSSQKSEIPSLENSRQSFELKELSREEYRAAQKEFLGLMNAHDPKFALTELRERVKTNHALLRSCHALVHEIGHEAYEYQHAKTC